MTVSHRKKAPTTRGLLRQFSHEKGKYLPFVSCICPHPTPHRDELHLQTLKAFVELHEFSDLNLVQALRSAPFICCLMNIILLSNHLTGTITYVYVQ